MNSRSSYSATALHSMLINIALIVFLLLVSSSVINAQEGSSDESVSVTTGEGSDENSDESIEQDPDESLDENSDDGQEETSDDDSSDDDFSGEDSSDEDLDDITDDDLDENVDDIDDDSFGEESIGACDVIIVETPEEVVLTYDPFFAGGTISQLKFKLNNQSASDCELKFTASILDQEPAFEFEYTDTEVVIELRPSEDQQGLVRTSQEGVFLMTIAGDTAIEFVLDAIVIKDAVAAAADHVLPIQFKYQDVSSEASLETSWLTDITLRSLPKAQVNLSGVSGSYGEVGSISVVDFGVAKKGAIRRVFVQLRANTPSTLTVVSENKGVLKHKTAPDKTPPIPYSAELDEEIIDLSEKYTKNFELPNNYEGKSFPLKLQLIEVGKGMAGKYSDILMFEFSPL